MRIVRNRVVLAAIALVLAFVLSGMIYDWRAQSYTRNNNAFGADGIINKAREVDIQRGSDRLIVIVHGFGASPLTMRPITTAFETETDDDIWAPLLAYHGRALEVFATLDPDEVRADILARIGERAAGYKDVVIFAHSFGGAVLFDLAAQKALPDNSRLIAIAPAIHILQDTRGSRRELGLFNLWAEYCGFEALGCVTPQQSDNPEILAFMEAQDIYDYLVIDAVLELFDFAKQVETVAGTVEQPIDIVMAKDDARVAYDPTLALCRALENCRMHVFPDGGHSLFIRLGAPVTDLLVALAKDPADTCGTACTTISAPAASGKTDRTVNET